MPSNEAPAAISEASIDHLDDVCRGKPRRFVMLCKGPSIVSLVLYKKGSVDKHIKEAKEAGSGTVSFGQVGGKGQNLVFKLAVADGFKVEPTTTAKLKTFLKESADRTIANPAFEIVDVFGPLLDADDPLVARFLKLKAAVPAAGAAHPDRAPELNRFCSEITAILDKDLSSDVAHGKVGQLEQALASLSRASEGLQVAAPAPTSPNAPPLPPNPEALRFAQRLKPLKPDLEKVLAGNVAATPGVQKAYGEASQAFKQQNFPAAHQALDQLAPLIKQGLDELVSRSLAAGDPGALFNQRLKALVPRIKAAAGTPAGDQAKLKASEAGAFAVKKDFTQASALLDQAESVLAPTGDGQPQSHPDQAGSQDGSGQAKFKERMEQLEQRLLEAQKANPGERNSLAGLWSFAVEKVALFDVSDETTRAESEQQAGRAIERMASAIDQALKSAPQTDAERFGIQAGLVAERRAELEKFFGERLAAVQANNDVQLKSVKQAIAEQVPYEEPEVLERAMKDAMSGLYKQVKDALDQRLKSEGTTPEEILKLVEQSRANVAAHPLVQVLKETKSHLAVDADVSADFEKLFDEVALKVKDLAAA